MQAVKKTKEVFLQTVGYEDVEQVHKWYADPELAEYFRRYPPIEEWRKPEQTIQGLGAGLVIVEGTTPVGLCQLVNFDQSAKSVEVGLLVDKTKCSNRWEVSQKAYDQLCEYLFNGLGYNKIVMKVLTHRHKLVSRLGELGFKVEGQLRNSCTFKGKLVDEYYLGLLKEDFNSRRKN